MSDWLVNETAARYTLSSDWDDNWRTGGTLDEVIEEAHLSPDHLLAGIERFVEDRERRLAEVAAALEEAQGQAPGAQPRRVA